MNIYVTHSREYDFENCLYRPIRESSLNSRHKIILPHEDTQEPFDSKSFLERECNLVVAEVSFPSTGQGIELGWANNYDVPIICFYQKGAKVYDSLSVVSSDMVEYSGCNELVLKLQEAIESMKEN